jgi:hypothetical protein
LLLGDSNVQIWADNAKASLSFNSAIFAHQGGSLLSTVDSSDNKKSEKTLKIMNLRNEIRDIEYLLPIKLDVLEPSLIVGMSIFINRFSNYFYFIH